MNHALRLGVIIILAFLITGIFALICLIGIKIKKLNYFHALKIKELFIIFLFSTLVWGIFAITVGSVVWLCGYFIFREVVFTQDYKRFTELYEKYAEKDRPYPPIKRFSELKEAFSFKSEWKIDVDRLPLSTYLFTASVLLALYFTGTVTESHTNAILFFTDCFFASTAVFIFLAKILYNGFYRSVRWGLQYSRAACIPVIVIGVFYYIILAYITVTSWCNINGI